MNKIALNDKTTLSFSGSTRSKGQFNITVVSEQYTLEDFRKTDWFDKDLEKRVAKAIKRFFPKNLNEEDRIKQAHFILYAISDCTHWYTDLGVHHSCTNVICGNPLREYRRNETFIVK